jgi:outer membrane protein TolC
MKPGIKYFAPVFFLSLTVLAQAPKPLSFAQALDQAVNGIEEVKSKESELRSAEASRTQSQFRFLPDLSLTGTAAETGPTWKEKTKDQSYSARTSVNLFKFGGDYYFFKANDLSTESSRWDLQNTKIKMEETIAVKVLNYIASHQETGIRRVLTEAQRSYFKIAEKRYAKGILSKQELDQITIDLKIAEARLEDARLQEFQNREDLKIYFGETDIEDSWPWDQQLRHWSKKTLAFNLQGHPEWKYLQNRLAAADYGQKNKFSEIAPSLDLSLTYGSQKNILTNFDWLPQWTSALTLTIPLFNRLENYTAYRLAAESKLRTDLDLQRAERELKAQWKTSETNFRVQLASALTREQTLKISNNLYQDNLRRFQAGRTNANDLFNDQERLFQSELLVVQGWRSAHESYIKLCHALGQLVGECAL